MVYIILLVFGCVYTIGQIQRTKNESWDTNRNKHNIDFHTRHKHDHAEQHCRNSSRSSEAIVMHIVFMFDDG
ncbi:hypothetical protein D3C78_1861130 [compost metagenome]